MASSKLHSTNPLQLPSGQVSGRRLFTQYVLGRFRGLKPIYSLFSKRHTKTEHFSHIIIISLSYPASPDGTTPAPALHGPKYDLNLMLKRNDYRHDDISGSFTIVNDFDLAFRDSTGVQKVIPKVDASPEAIEAAIKNTMRKTDANSQVLFYFAGHAVEVDDAASTEASVSQKPPQAIVAGNGESIFGSELRSWLCAEARSGASVTAVFDACASAGMLDLSYQYEYKSKRAQIEKASNNEMPISMVEIAAARRGQHAYSNAFEGGYHGQLTWCLTQYFTHTKNPTVEGLVSHLHRKCDPSGDQLPQVCSSRELKDLHFSL